MKYENKFAEKCILSLFCIVLKKSINNQFYLKIDKHSLAYKIKGLLIKTKKVVANNPKRKKMTENSLMSQLKLFFGPQLRVLPTFPFPYPTGNTK